MIHNIDVHKDYDKIMGNEDVHYQTFNNMASHFGRDMKAHRHDGFYQVHFLLYGRISILLEDEHYEYVQGPMFILTPPSAPHAFITKEGTIGHVVTVRQSIINPLLENIYAQSIDTIKLKPNFYTLNEDKQDADIIERYFQLIALESQYNNQGKDEVLSCLVKALFAFLFRFCDKVESKINLVKGDVKLFMRFNYLIDDHYKEHLNISDYAKMLGVSETRLKDMCRRQAQSSPKKMILDKLFLEAKNLLKFSDLSVLEIAYHLGFKDPAYFARFFTKLEGICPSKWRSNLGIKN